jgi:hypothetical protein
MLLVSVALITLSADSLQSLFPQHSANTYKLWGVLVFVIISTLAMNVDAKTAPQISAYGIHTTVATITNVYTWDYINLVHRRRSLH